MSWLGWVIIIGLVGLLALSFFVIVPWLVKREMMKLIRRFMQLNALSANFAVTEKELGVRRGLFQIKALRDYSGSAMNLFVQNGIVQTTPEGKFFLIEDNLGMLKFWKTSPPPPQQS